MRTGVGIGLGRETPDVDFPELTYLNVTDFNERYTVFCYYNPQTHYGNVKGFVDFLKAKHLQTLSIR